MANIETYVDGLEGYVDSLETYTDGLETLLGDVKTKLDTIITNTNDLDTNTDGIEALLTTMDATLTTITGQLVTQLANWVTQLAAMVTNNSHLSNIYNQFQPSYTVVQSLNAITSSKQYHLVDISDTTNYPHGSTGDIVIKYIYITVEPNSSWAGDIFIGYLSNVDTSNGDILYIRKYAVVEYEVIIEEFRQGINCAELLGNKNLNSPVFQTDVNLQASYDLSAAPSGDGDLILWVEPSAGSLDMTIHITYEVV